jgi:hypothetical protein
MAQDAKTSWRGIWAGFLLQFFGLAPPAAGSVVIQQRFRRFLNLLITPAITVTDAKPVDRADSARAYCRRWLSVWSATWPTVD